MAFWRRLAVPRLAVSILAANGLALAILIAGMLAMGETRRGLVDAKIDALRAEGELIANILAEGATEGDPAPILRHDDARALLRQLYVPQDTRVRIFDKGGLTVADSHALADRFDILELPPPGEGPARPPAAPGRDAFSRLLDGLADLLRSPEERAALQRDVADEISAAVQGDLAAGVRRTEGGSRVVSVSVPIQPVRAVVGVVTLESFDLDALIAAERRALIPFIVIAVIVIVFASLLLTLFIARPVRRLALAAHEARLSGGRRVKMPDLSHRRDEIGDLGAALSAMTDALYDRIDAIERFAADVAHELKNPLTSIRSAADMLPHAKDGQRDKLLAVIRGDVRRLDRLITDISRASRLDAELAREDADELDLDALLRDLAESYIATAEEGGPRVVFESQAPEARIPGRPGPLGQVFRNLVDNAITFSPPGGTVRIETRRVTAGGRRWLAVTVEDNGPGIPEENLETVFERFYTQRPKGAEFGAHSGLGLAIARQIVAAHGGHIHAGARRGPDGEVAGARFTVELPCA